MRINRTPVLRNSIGGLLLFIGLVSFIWMLSVPAADPWSRLPLSIAAGVVIGLGYQLAPITRRKPDGQINVLWCRIALWTSVTTAAGAAVTVFLRWPGVWAGMLTISTAAFAVYLAERHPAGGKWPGIFLLSPVFDALMVFQLTNTDSFAEAAVAAALFLPALAVAITLTVWAFTVRMLSAADYAKATEVARGVLYAWLLLIVASAAWTWSGWKLGSVGSLDPLSFAVPLVTFGSVIATATAGWTRFQEARAQLAKNAAEWATEGGDEGWSSRCILARSMTSPGLKCAEFRFDGNGKRPPSGSSKAPDFPSTHTILG